MTNVEFDCNFKFILIRLNLFEIIALIESVNLT